MPDKEVPINFDAPAALRKWPSLNNERVSASLGARPYTIIDGTLDECIRKFMAMPVGQHHLYEIHTAPQSDLVGAVLSSAHIVELARLRDFLEACNSLPGTFHDPGLPRVSQRSKLVLGRRGLQFLQRKFELIQ
jgi:hypothetical protein